MSVYDSDDDDSFDVHSLLVSTDLNKSESSDADDVTVDIDYYVWSNQSVSICYDTVFNFLYLSMAQKIYIIVKLMLVLLTSTCQRGRVTNYSISLYSFITIVVFMKHLRI